MQVVMRIVKLIFGLVVIIQLVVLAQSSHIPLYQAAGRVSHTTTSLDKASDEVGDSITSRIVIRRGFVRPWQNFACTCSHNATLSSSCSPSPNDDTYLLIDISDAVNYSDKYVEVAGYTSRCTDCCCVNVFFMREVPYAPECGDVDANGCVDIRDSEGLISYIFAGAILEALEAGDVDCNGRVDISDVVILLHYLYEDGGPLCTNCNYA